jgi:carbamoyl-phosphate synthase large subunit
MNVLLTSAGRRNYLIRYFREALQGDGIVVAADAQASAPALEEADVAVCIPMAGDPDYQGALEAIVRQYDIGLVISLNDLELPRLASLKSALEALGARVAIADREVVNLCFDKLQSVDFLGRHGIGVPLTYASLQKALAAVGRRELSYPLMLKPRWGTASIGVEVAHDRDSLEHGFRYLERKMRHTMLGEGSCKSPSCAILIQQMMRGEEYGLDIINDLDGGYAATIAKRKLSMRAGETDKAITVSDPALTALGNQLGRVLRHRGNLDCDVFVTQDGPFVIDLNPRFGGGYPFSHTAGANVPAALIGWARGEPVDSAWLTVRPGVVSAKFDCVLVSEVRDEQ